MARYQLTNRASDQLSTIYSYSVIKFGIDQARLYLTGLQKAFELIAENPRMGRDCSNIKLGYRRHEHNQHVIYYKALRACKNLRFYRCEE